MIVFYFIFLTFVNLVIFVAAFFAYEKAKHLNNETKNQNRNLKHYLDFCNDVDNEINEILKN